MGFLFRNKKFDAGGIAIATPYKRWIRIERGAHQGNCNEMAIITVDITWSDRFGTKRYTLEDHLYNWVGSGIVDNTKTTPCQAQ